LWLQEEEAVVQHGMIHPMGLVVVELVVTEQEHYLLLPVMVIRLLLVLVVLAQLMFQAVELAYRALAGVILFFRPLPHLGEVVAVLVTVRQPIWLV
jgi:hypothetical protein